MSNLASILDRSDVGRLILAELVRLELDLTIYMDDTSGTLPRRALQTVT